MNLGVVLGRCAVIGIMRKRVLSLLMAAMAAWNGMGLCAAEQISQQEFEGRYNILTTSRSNSPNRRRMGFYAIIDGTRYPLKTIGPGIFTDRDGSRIVFERGEGNKVSNYRLLEANRTNFFPRISDVDFPVTMWSARPSGGTSPYRFEYVKPPELSDGLEVGTLREGGLDSKLIAEMVEQIANETHRNVHSVLIVRNGELVLEEYFYQYDLMQLVSGGNRDR
jgi:hypothetical protein